MKRKHQTFQALCPDKRRYDYRGQRKCRIGTCVLQATEVPVIKLEHLIFRAKLHTTLCFVCLWSLVMQIHIYTVYIYIYLSLINLYSITKLNKPITYKQASTGISVDVSKVFHDDEWISYPHGETKSRFKKKKTSLFCLCFSPNVCGWTG